MIKPKLFITDERMLKLIDYAVNTGLVKNEQEYFERIKFVRNSKNKVKQGIQGFTKEHIYNACKFTGASADWIYGFTNEMKRERSRSSIRALKEAVFAVEEELKVHKNGHAINGIKLVNSGVKIASNG